MSNINKIAEEEITKLEKVLEEIETFLVGAPKGCLKWQNRGKKTYYYQQYSEPDKDMPDIKDNPKRRYLKKDENQLAKMLAKKHYYSLLKTISEKQLAVLRSFVKKYPDKDIEDIYDELSVERRMLIEPLPMSVKAEVGRWENEVYEQATMYPEGLKFETEQGEVVRSKSEVIIANSLYKNRQDILYKYERPLKLVVNGMKKMNMYMSNDILPGRDVIYTFETLDNPLNIRVVKKMIKSLV